MSKPVVIEFNFSDGTTHDASVSEISDAIEICYNYNWSLAPNSIGLDADPTYTIEVSNNNIDWSAYEDPTVDAAIDQGFDDIHFAWLYVRVNYNAVANTTGTVEFKLVFKS
tara:strand:+ start:1321 stop:1653 length:333 start_codon:yes stop_codon:yes gene_type:complete